MTFRVGDRVRVADRAHEGHHRGQILLALKANKHMVDRKVQYGLWEWGVR